MPDLRETMDRLGIVGGRSVAFADTLAQIEAAAPSDRPVLLYGTIGTGKAELARLLHALSRPEAPFVECNCAAIPEDMLQADLRGPSSCCAAGSVTALASDGILVLNEVDGIGADGWAIVKSFLEERTYWDAARQRSVVSSARLVLIAKYPFIGEDAFATAIARQHHDIWETLHPIVVSVPTLAERIDDIAPLAEHFARDAAARHGLPLRPFAPAAMRAIVAAEWPASVLQLSRAIERAVIRCDGDDATEIRAVHLRLA